MDQCQKLVKRKQTLAHNGGKVLELCTHKITDACYVLAIFTYRVL